MVLILRKATLPSAEEVMEHLRLATEQAHSIQLREPRPAGFPLLFTPDMRLIEPAVAFLHEHGVRRAHTTDTIRSYSEILYDWFETLEQNNIDWAKADAADLVAYRNRMMMQPSAHTGRPYRLSTINHRVRGVLRFYDWAVSKRWLASSELAGEAGNFALARRPQSGHAPSIQSADRSLFVLRQFELLPRPLTSEQARELLAALAPPYDLMARWQLYTGLRIGELLRLGNEAVNGRSTSTAAYMVEVMRKGRKPGYVIAPNSLLDETKSYQRTYRYAWLQRASGRGRQVDHTALFINARGAPVGRNSYQRVISQAGVDCGFKATTHLLRATFACMLLARLERLASSGVAVNPLLVVKVLMGHERIETTDRYLRAIAVDIESFKEVLGTLLPDT